MANQYTVTHEKVIDVSFLHYLCRWTIKELSKKLRLNSKTIRRILKNERATWIKRTENEQIKEEIKNEETNPD